MFKLDLEKAEEPEIKLPTSAGSSNKQESSRKTSIAALLTAKAFDCVDHNKLWNIFKKIGMLDHLICWGSCMQVMKQQLGLDMGQQTGFKSGKEYMSRLYIVTLLI